MDSTNEIDGIAVRIDTNGHFWGFGFVIGARTYSGGGFASARRAMQAARAAVRKARRDAASREERRLDHLRVTIGDKARPSGY